VRTKTLLQAAVEALENGEDPFHESFLRSHNVTIHEAYDLADLLAVGGRFVLLSLSEDRS
jgi:hypothetical protein